jgi:hypothetical protein
VRWRWRLPVATACSRNSQKTVAFSLPVHQSPQGLRSPHEIAPPRYIAEPGCQALVSDVKRPRDALVTEGNPRSGADRSSRVATPASAPQAVSPRRAGARGPNGVQMSGDESGTVALDHHRRADALLDRIAIVAARAAVHRCLRPAVLGRGRHEHQVGRVPSAA